MTFLKTSSGASIKARTQYLRRILLSKIPDTAIAFIKHRKRMVCGRWDIREVDQTRKHVFRNAKSISALQVSCPSQTSTPSMLDSNPVTTLIVAIITVQSASDRVTSLSQSDACIFKKPIPKTREPVLAYRRLYVTLLMSENYLIFFLGIIIPATASASIRSRRIEQILDIAAPV